MSALQDISPQASAQNPPATKRRMSSPAPHNSGAQGLSKGSLSKSPARLTVAEKAFARGLTALREKDYRDAERQLSGFRELTRHFNTSEPSGSPAKQSQRLQEIRVGVEALQLLLAISEEITILEREAR